MTKTATEELTAITTREITMSYAGTDKVVRDFRTVPAGTTVYAHVPARGALIIRLPGTLYTQRVSLMDIEPA